MGNFDGILHQKAVDSARQAFYNAFQLKAE